MDRPRCIQCTVKHSNIVGVVGYPIATRPASDLGLTPLGQVAVAQRVRAAQGKWWVTLRDFTQDNMAG